MYFGYFTAFIYLIKLLSALARDRMERWELLRIVMPRKSVGFMTIDYLRSITPCLRRVVSVGNTLKEGVEPLGFSSIVGLIINNGNLRWIVYNSLLDQLQYLEVVCSCYAWLPHLSKSTSLEPLVMVEDTTELRTATTNNTPFVLFNSSY